MDKVLQGYEYYSSACLDDVVIFSKTLEEHLEHLHRVLGARVLVFSWPCGLVNMVHSPVCHNCSCWPTGPWGLWKWVSGSEREIVHFSCVAEFWLWKMLLIASGCFRNLILQITDNTYKHTHTHTHTHVVSPPELSFSFHMRHIGKRKKTLFT